ncbi:MAG: FMN-binding protein [Bacteroidales bacterium]
MKTCVLFVLCMLLFWLACEPDKMMAPITIENVDLAIVADGTYTGEYTDEKSGEMSEVEVVVKDHVILSIVVLKRITTPVGKKGEYVITQVLTAQSLDVDGISGATMTSNITLKAIEMALKKGIQP